MSLSARHTLGAPSPEQLRRWDAIRVGGCVACRSLLKLHNAPQIHHMTLGGRHGALRLGHDYTIGLCPWHHVGHNPFQQLGSVDMEMLRGPSYALTPKAFRREFGNDQQLLDAQQDLLGLPRIVIPTRRPKATMTTVREQQEARGPSGNKGRRRSSRCQRSDKTVPRGARIV